jgi:hypothetical protein
MATFTANRLTLIELAKRTKDGNISAIAEVLNQVNTVLDDAVWSAANGLTSHMTTKRIALPTGSWRKINSGVARESSRTAQVTEVIGMLEAFSQADEALVDISPNPGEFRWSEDVAFIEGLSQTLATAIFYSTTAGYPEKFNGFATRYASLTTANVSATNNVHSCGGTGSSLSSAWIVQWGTDKVHMVYPGNSNTVGISVKDDGLQTVYDANNNPFKVYQSHFKVYAGLVVRDDRSVQRICNISATRATGAWSDEMMIAAIREMPYGGAGAVIYANRSVLTLMDIDSKDKANVFYGAPDAWGRPTMMFRGYPVKQVDALTATESAVT